MGTSQVIKDKQTRSAVPCLVILLALGAGGLLFLLLSIMPGSSLRSLSGVTSPGFSNYQVNANFTRFTANDQDYWDISYEKTKSTRFSGIVRHTSNNNIADFPMLTHDVLVTSQDFADPLKVATSVSDHHFTWISLSKDRPVGSINLLHTLPKNDEIFQQLRAIQPGDLVTISGWEIGRIDARQPDGSIIRWWQDAGCNTLLVDFVSIEGEDTP